MSTKSLVVALAVAATLGTVTLANAAVCTGPEPSSYDPALGDVTINGVEASSCAYHAGNDNFWSPGAGWTSVGKSDDDNPITGNVDLDPTGTVSLSLLLTPDDEPAGDLLLTWTGGPALMDFVFVLKASNKFFTYTFLDFLLTPAAGGYTGSYRVAIENRNGANQNLSHLTFWARGEVVDLPGPNPVPAPGVLALLGIGALATSVLGRRRNN